MFRGFNLEIKDKNNNIFNKSNYDIGNNEYKKVQTSVEDNLNKYIGKNGSLDGTKIQDDWFPIAKDINIFISHSHNDKKLSIQLAGWLYKEFKLKSFIDSCVWGYSNDLLKEIDKEYCSSGEDFYYYEKRNFSTSHVHMMLSTALIKMIDRAECIFFLNTDKSVVVKDVIENKTNSPWIYSEIVATNLVRTTDLSDERINKLKQQKLEKKFFTEDSLIVQYDLELGDLYPINDEILNKWINVNHMNKSEKTDALDNLYGLYKY